MANTAAYVEGLSDEALYKELMRHDFPAGPVVASTRQLYRRKLKEILENRDQHSDEIPAKDDEPSFLKSDNSRWSSFATNSSSHLSYEQEEVPSRLNLSHSSPSYRNYEDDTARSRFSYLKSQDTSPLPSSSLLSRDYTSPSFRSSLSGTRNDDSFLRTRNIYTDTRSEMSPRYRLPGFPEEHSARMARHIQPQPKQKGLQLIIYGATILTVVILLYILYNAWSENDPYRQIEEEAKKLIEESNT